MANVQSIFLYIFSFIALYAQVFLLIVAFKKRQQVLAGTIVPSTFDWPGVTVIVPCWNEERTVEKTVHSLLALDYPREKLFIKVVNDGSTDSTWEKMQQFAGMQNIELINKENGGKHTAMNKAIESTTTEFVGCLDADAFAQPDALKKLMYHFTLDPKAMAVSPSILAYNPQGFWQKAQQVEYDMAVFVKKILGIIEGIHVTPGPFSIYRKKVFDDLGMYRKAHNAEDMEIAYRMQVNGYKIVQCHDAYVFTVTPNTFKKLFRQRLRWMYGFINNTLDYRKYLFKPKYGAFSVFTVPSATVALFGTVIMSIFALVGFGQGLYHLVERLIVTQFYVSTPTVSGFSFFFVDVRPLSLVMIVLYATLLTTILLGQKMRDKRPLPGISIAYFVILFSVMAPLWLLKATYNTVMARETAWR